MMKKFSFVLLMTFLLGFVLSSAAYADENKNIRLGVMKFLSRAEGVSDKQAEAIGDIFARMLANSKAITVV